MFGVLGGAANWLGEKTGLSEVGSNVMNGLDRSNNQYKDIDQKNFGLPGYGTLTGQHGALIQQLQRQAAGRGPSMADMQMQRGLQGALAQQQALAQSGRGNAAMAGRQAAINSGNIAQNLAGQGAMARLAEQQGARQQLQGALAGQLNVQRSQQQGNMAYEDARTNRFGAMMGQPTNTEKLLNVGGQLSGMFF